MRVFFDCEFTGLHQETTLVSIGFISENDDELYLELNDCDWIAINKDEWLTKHVKGNLVKKTPFHVGHPMNSVHNWQENRTTSVIAAVVIQQWLAQWDEVEIWSDTLAYDWVLFCELWGGALNIPPNVDYIPFDLSTLFKLKGIDPDIGRIDYAGMTQGEDKAHNALFDARVIKACYGRLMK